jgi:hypothetical protein
MQIQIRPGVVRRQRPSAQRSRQVRWEVWCRFGDREPTRAAVYGCPHTAQAECTTLNATPAMRSWITVTS